MQEIAESSKTILRDHGLSQELEIILNDPVQQLLAAVIAVFESWNKERAQRYRDIKGIAHSWQTAVIVQEMAFGNGRNEPIRPEMDEILVSLTGVIPRTTVNEFGIRELSGEFKFSAAGDDLVGGVTSSGSFHSFDELDALMPMLGRRLRHAASKLRRFMGTDQEMEFRPMPIKRSSNSWSRVSRPCADSACAAAASEAWSLLTMATGRS
jgi:phosphoenolpyruvate synthase/pyruvate phosphate dikinase